MRDMIGERNLVLTRSIHLDEEFWYELRDAAAELGLTIGALLAKIEGEERIMTECLSGVVRVYLIERLKRRGAGMNYSDAVRKHFNRMK